MLFYDGDGVVDYISKGIECVESEEGFVGRVPIESAGVGVEQIDGEGERICQGQVYIV